MPGAGTPRAAWNRNETQPCAAFHNSTGENTSNASSAAAQGWGRTSQRRRVELVSRNAKVPASTNTP